MLVFALGLGAMFVAVTTAANEGVPADKAGLAAALLNASQQVGGALGLAIFSAIATSRINDLLASKLDLTPAHTCPLRKSEPLSVSIPSLRKGRAWAISSSACTTAACPRPSTARDSVQPL